MAALIGALLSAWVIGYSLGWKVKAISDALKAA